MINPVDPDVMVRVSAWELDEWAWLCSHLERWTNDAGWAVRRDYQDHTWPRGPYLDDVTWQLASMANRMRRLAGGLVKGPLA